MQVHSQNYGDDPNYNTLHREGMMSGLDIIAEKIIRAIVVLLVMGFWFVMGILVGKFIL